jgi:hypothetical protein
MQVQLLGIQSLDGWSVLLARARPDCRTKSSRNIPTIGFNRVDHLVGSIGQDQFPQWDDGIGDTLYQPGVKRGTRRIQTSNDNERFAAESSLFIVCSPGDGVRLFVC